MQLTRTFTRLLSGAEPIVGDRPGRVVGAFNLWHRSQACREQADIKELVPIALAPAEHRPRVPMKLASPCPDPAYETCREVPRPQAMTEFDDFPHLKRRVMWQQNQAPRTLCPLHQFTSTDLAAAQQTMPI